jgi:hypothetical protein
MTNNGERRRRTSQHMTPGWESGPLQGRGC